MWFYLFKKEIQFLKNNSQEILSYVILLFLFLFISVLIIGNNVDILNYISIFFLNNHFFIISILISSNIFKRNGDYKTLRLYLNSNIKLEHYFVIKLILYWLFFFFPIITIIYINIIIMNINNNYDILLIIIIYLIYGLITIFINTVSYLVSFSIKNNLISLLFNQILNIPLIILCTNIITLSKNEFNYGIYLTGLLIILILTIFLSPFIISIVYHIKE